MVIDHPAEKLEMVSVRILQPVVFNLNLAVEERIIRDFSNPSCRLCRYGDYVNASQNSIYANGDVPPGYNGISVSPIDSIHTTRYDG
ncbi:hypothetical protein BV898_12244 [Hypsibius exemplaris]|uniref:Uncharacterized protein n=1 Tax=Hypsibius exemplaris TaxID=2072580 RepID=A0A1W0WE61_HYPEX|nr:hypothetical protein BV898_12244 [Hypsibius exemplaris]